MEALGYTGYSFSRKLSTSEAVISNVRLGKNPPNVQLVQGLLKEHEDVDPGWLLTGKGQMFRKGGGDGLGPEKVQELTELFDQRFDELVKLMKRSLASQLERNALVDEAISGLEKQVGELRRPGPVKKGHRKEA